MKTLKLAVNRACSFLIFLGQILPQVLRSVHNILCHLAVGHALHPFHHQGRPFLAHWASEATSDVDMDACAELRSSRLRKWGVSFLHSCIPTLCNHVFHTSLHKPTLISDLLAFRLVLLNLVRFVKFWDTNRTGRWLQHACSTRVYLAATG